MKKWICLMLVMLIAAGCAGGMAENAETSFVQIKENVTAKVYAEPGDTAAADMLESGRICGLMDETTEAGVALLCVLYLDSARKGRIGYIGAEDANKLTQEELTALLEDTEKLNEVLDLIDAVNDYLKDQTGSGSGQADAGTKANGGTGGANQAGKQDIQQFLGEAMEILKLVSDGLGQADSSGKAEAAQEIEKKAKGAGMDLLDQARDIVASAKDAAKDKLDDAKDQINSIVPDDETIENARNQLLVRLMTWIAKVKENIPDRQEIQGKVDELKENQKVAALQDQIDELVQNLQSGALQEKVQGIEQKVDDLRNNVNTPSVDINKVVQDLKNLFKSE